MAKPEIKTITQYEVMGRLYSSREDAVVALKEAELEKFIETMCGPDDTSEMRNFVFNFIKNNARELSSVVCNLSGAYGALTIKKLTTT